MPSPQVPGSRSHTGAVPLRAAPGPWREVISRSRVEGTGKKTWICPLLPSAYSRGGGGRGGGAASLCVIHHSLPRRAFFLTVPKGRLYAGQERGAVAPCAPPGLTSMGGRASTHIGGGAEGEAPGYGSPVPALGLSTRRYIPVGRPSTEARGFWPSVVSGRRSALVLLTHSPSGHCLYPSGYEGSVPSLGPLFTVVLQ